MIITICSSLNFTKEIDVVAGQLRNEGHHVYIPKTAEEIINGNISLEQIKKEKETGEISKRAASFDAIKTHYDKIMKSDAILVINIEKNGVRDYIGPSVFLEMGFAHVLGKRIFLWNNVPSVPWTDEMMSMNLHIISHDIGKIL